jgi:hypothetical protein
MSLRICLIASLITAPLVAADKEAAPPQVASQAAFRPFTGKITGNQVRLRSAPNLASATVRELGRNDMVVVVGEMSDFYVVQAPAGLKGYVYRTYVLDDVIEGQRVNVRLAPDLEAPVIAQLNTGDPCKGVMAPQNNKWLEIELPSTARLYVAKEYIESAGGPELFQERQRRTQEIAELLNAAYLISQSEMRKPYTDVDMKRIEQAFEPVISQYSDFPQQVAKAKEALKQVQELHTQKKVTHLESKQLDGPNLNRTQRKELEGQVKAQQDRLAALEEQVEKALSQAQQTVDKPVAKAEAPKPAVKVEATKPAAKVEPTKSAPKAEKAAAEKPKTEKVAVAAPKAEVKAKPADKATAKAAEPTGWAAVEEKLFTAWAAEHSPATLEAFYMEESLTAVELTGTIEPYREPLRNRPGDYILYDNYRPLCYLYSTQVDLASLVGKKVSLQLAPRTNHHFAHPAYHVLSAEPS